MNGHFRGDFGERRPRDGGRPHPRQNAPKPRPSCGSGALDPEAMAATERLRELTSLLAAGSPWHRGPVTGHRGE